MLRTFFTMATAAVAMIAMAVTPVEYKLWSDSGSLTDLQKLPANFDRENQPYVYLYQAEGKQEAKPAVVICPGGGYEWLSMDNEGHEVAKWFNDQGFTAIVLKYRLPHNDYMIPRADVQRAMELVRANSDKWGVDKNKVGVIGFSAGGHLASTCATHFTTADNRPDFAMLIYPVISMDPTLTHGHTRLNLIGEKPSEGLASAFSNDKRVTADTPPCFIAFSNDDDIVDPRNGTRMYEALYQAGVPAELHIYPVGKHGWGLRDNFPWSGQFKASLKQWLDRQLNASENK